MKPAKGVKGDERRTNAESPLGPVGRRFPTVTLAVGEFRITPAWLAISTLLSRVLLTQTPIGFPPTLALFTYRACGCS
jgi:hypothetical protein